jgi:hypothetical protein
LLLVVVSGCNIGGGGSSEQYRKGSQGIVLSFVENAPPSQLFDTDSLTIGIKATNMGAESADVRIIVSGFDPSIITMGNTASVHIAGKEEVYNPTEGESETVFFKQSSTNLGDANSYSPNIMATACYSYKSVAEADVCINGNPIVNRGVCSPSNIQLSGGQGGPVGITNIEVAATPGKTNFKIYIKNLGSGGPCKNNQPAELEEVGVESVKVHNLNLNCKPLTSGMVRLINGEAVLYCEMNGIDLNRVYTTPMVISLYYDYSTSITTPVQIVKAPV